MFCFQCEKILLGLEDRLRAEILHHLKQHEAENVPSNPSDINLDEEYISDVESRSERSIEHTDEGHCEAL